MSEEDIMIGEGLFVLLIALFVLTKLWRDRK